jgi:hypothetical protein
MVTRQMGAEEKPPEAGLSSAYDPAAGPSTPLAEKRPTRLGVPSTRPVNAVLAIVAQTPLVVGPIRSDTLPKWARPPVARTLRLRTAEKANYAQWRLARACQVRRGRDHHLD